MSFYGDRASEVSWEEEEAAARNDNAGKSTYGEEAKQEGGEGGVSAPAAAAPAAAPPAAAVPAAAAAAAGRGGSAAAPQVIRQRRPRASVSFVELSPGDLAAAAAFPAPSPAPPAPFFLARPLDAWRAFRGDAKTEAAQSRAIRNGFAPDATYDGPLLRLRGRAALDVHAYAQRVFLGAAFCGGAFGGVDPFVEEEGEEGALAEVRLPFAPGGGGGGGAGGGDDVDGAAASIAAALRLLPPPPVRVEVVSVVVAASPFSDAGPGAAAPASDEGGGGGAADATALVTYRACYRLPVRLPPWPLSALLPSPRPVTLWATDTLCVRVPASAAAAAAGGQQQQQQQQGEIFAVVSRPHNWPVVLPGFVRRALGATSTWFLGEVLRW